MMITISKDVNINSKVFIQVILNKGCKNICLIVYLQLYKYVYNNYL